MSLANELALPQDVEIDGRKGRLHTLGWTEYGKVERLWEAHLRWIALKSTEGLLPTERQEALEGAARAVSNLIVDITPLTSWILSSNEGTTAALTVCLEMEDGKAVTIHEISAWIAKMGGVQKGDTTIDKWLIASGLRSDPTPAVQETDESSPPPSESSDTSNEASLVGATES